MIRVITVEREYGSQGAEFARLLAERLGWQLADHALIEEVARRANVPPEIAERRDEQLDPWYNRFGRVIWQGNSERSVVIGQNEVFNTERMTSLLQEVMRERAQAGNCVIVGRGAACALHGIPGCFHAFVYASTARKARWFAEIFPERARSAERDLLAMDQRRAGYVQHFYGATWNDYRLYHLMLNSCMGFDAMVEAAIKAAGL
jgi:hypothetical protein